MSPCEGYIVFWRKSRINVGKDAKLMKEKMNQHKKRFCNDTFRDELVRKTAFTKVQSTAHRHLYMKIAY